MEQLRGVGYWQRLVQARTDLQVAGLLYAAPVPTSAAAITTSAPRPQGPWAPGTHGEEDLTTLTAPPAGLDVMGLLGAGTRDPGAQLDRLREVALVLVRRSMSLQEELDTVTSALHETLARDGAADGTVGPTGTIPSASGARASSTA